MATLVGSVIVAVMPAPPPEKAFEAIGSGTTLSLIGLWAGVLDRVWGTGPDDVFAAGEEGAVLHYDGASWRPLPTGAAEFLYTVWGTVSAVAQIIGGLPTPAKGRRASFVRTADPGGCP